MTIFMMYRSGFGVRFIAVCFSLTLMSFLFRYAPCALLGPHSFVFNRMGAMFPSSLWRRLRVAMRCFNPRSLLVISCFFLILNFLLYILRKHFLDFRIEAYFLCPLTPFDMEWVGRMFRVFIEAVEGANLTYFIYGGTLVGSLRHHNRIPWDDEVDIIMRADDRPRITEVLSRMEPDYGLFIADNDYWAYQWKFYPMAGRYLFRRQYRTPFIDLFFYRENETHVWNTHPDYLPEETWLRRHIFPLRRRPFGELSVIAPCNGPAVVRSYYNISVCSSREFNHMIDRRISSQPVSVPCDRLAHMYPFVRSRQVNGSSFVLETLMLGSWSIRHITTKAPC